MIATHCNGSAAGLSASLSEAGVTLVTKCRINSGSCLALLADMVLCAPGQPAGQRMSVSRGCALQRGVNHRVHI